MLQPGLEACTPFSFLRQNEQPEDLIIASFPYISFISRFPPPFLHSQTAHLPLFLCHWCRQPEGVLWKELAHGSWGFTDIIGVHWVKSLDDTPFKRWAFIKGVFFKDYRWTGLQGPGFGEKIWEGYMAGKREFTCYRHLCFFVVFSGRTGS